MFRDLAASLMFFALGANAQVAELKDQASATALLQRASGLIATKPGEAVKILLQARKLDPGRVEIRYNLAVAYDATGDLADADAELHEALARDPNFASAHNYLGIVLYKSGNPGAAAAEFRIAVRLAPNDPMPTSI